MDKKEIKKFVDDLEKDGIKELMYNLCKSGKVAIVQFYSPDHINKIYGKIPTREEMLEIQRMMEDDWETMEHCSDCLKFFIENLKNK